jgi:nucleoside-diphosphate-sugar epimerase
VGLLDSTIWLADVDATAAAIPDIGQLSGRSVLVTGATGLIGSALVDVLGRWNATHPGLSPIRIAIAGRSEERVRARFAPFFGAPWFSFAAFDAAAVAGDAPSADIVVHAAGNASPANITREPVETMLAHFWGLERLLDAARRHPGSRVLFVSSSEVYGKKTGDAPFREDEYGWIDLLNPRNSYSLAKRAGETLCAAFAAEHGVDFVVARPGHIYGPTASLSDNRVSSAWAFAAARGEDIVLKSDGAQLRSYCHCLDCASALLAVLLRGGKGRAFNIANPASVLSIRDMARILAASAGVRLRMELPSEAERKGFNPMPNSSLDASSLLALGWTGRYDAPTGFARTVEVLRDVVRQEVSRHA